jgi:NADP-dependent 3-hydroxy acid dehydrogenase YdfG
MRKVVAITGAASGMGRAIADSLAGDGVKLALGDRDTKTLAQAESDLTSSVSALVARELDVTDEASVRDFFSAATGQLGPIDVLLNVPGVSVVGKIAEMSVEDYQRIMDVNVKGTFLCSKHYLATAVPQAGGLIINFASMASKRANPNAPVYCTAKSAVAMFSQGLALQAKEQDVRVTTLCPGPTDTGFWGDRPVPREKFMRVEDIVATVRYVLSLPPRVVVHEVAFESFDFIK